MTDRLSLYNDALLHCGERSLSSVSEARESRYLLDQVWNGNAVIRCLEDGQWHFAMRTVMLDYDPSIQPDFGYTRAFTKPEDWVITSAVGEEEYFRVPCTRSVDEKGYWYADLDVLYVRYVSKDVQYGMDLNKWPQSFADFVGVHFASRIITKLSNSEKEWDKIFKLREKYKKEAKGRAAMAEPTSFPARGTWSRARTKGSRRGDGGNNGSLIG